MSKKPLRFFLLLLTIFLVGCYAQPQAQTEITVVMHENGFTPASWRVPAGATITLHIDNQDSTSHDWTIIFRQTIPPADTVDPANVYWKTSIPASKTETVQFTAPAAAGVYQVVSSEALADGMVGRLTVERLDSSK